MFSPPIQQNPKLLLRIFRGKNSSEIFQSRILLWTRITRKEVRISICLTQNTKKTFSFFLFSKFKALYIMKIFVI